MTSASLFLNCKRGTLKRRIWIHRFAVFRIFLRVPGQSGNDHENAGKQSVCTMYNNYMPLVIQQNGRICGKKYWA